jgi:hypothetical protein
MAVTAVKAKSAKNRPFINPHHPFERVSWTTTIAVIQASVVRNRAWNVRTSVGLPGFNGKRMVASARGEKMDGEGYGQTAEH